MVAARLPHRAWKEVHAPGLYLHLEPRRSFLGAAFGIPIQTPGRWYARRSFATRRNGKAPPAAGPFKALCELSGDSMKRMPSSYEPDHPFARDLMRKDFMTDTYFTEKQVCALDFLAQVLKATRAAGPFLEFLTHAVGLPWGRGRERQTARAVEN
jgi:uncharacterized protein (DUF2461 family)